MMAGFSIRDLHEENILGYFAMMAGFSSHDLLEENILVYFAMIAGSSRQLKDWLHCAGYERIRSFSTKALPYLPQNVVKMYDLPMKFELVDELRSLSVPVLY
jgi:hypothetical protein